MAGRAVRDDIHFIDGAFWGRNPQEELAWLREHAPVYWDGAIWGISKYDDVRKISKDPATFSSAGGIRPETGPVSMMIDMDDPEHWGRRRLVNRGYTPPRVRHREADLARLCDQIIDEVCERGECDFVRDIAARLPLVVIADDLGVEPEDRDQLLRWSEALLDALVGEPGGEAATAEAFVGYSEFATRAIAERRAEPRDDVMSTLCHAEIDGHKLDDASIISESLLILIGGDETTRHVISGGLYQLLSDGTSWAELSVDRDKLGTGIEEMLRWVSPIKNMARIATCDIEYGGQKIRQGDKLLLLYPSANRDADEFPDPQHFDVNRDPNVHVAFGYGSHLCLGHSLARLELRTMFNALFDRLPDLTLVDQAEPEYRAANFVSGYKTMPVSFTPSAKIVAPA
jgi:cytochrome P450 family 142 subfamily A polypeptide 1